MRPGFNVCITLPRKPLAGMRERAFRRLTVNRSSRTLESQPGVYIPKGGRARSFEDMAAGQICSSSGLWYPASQIKWVNGRAYGRDMGPGG
jgi:hypothetical protein